MDDRERLIALIYEGVIDGEVWQELLALLGYRLNAAGTGLGLQDMATHEFRAVAEAGIDRGLHETYRRLAPENRKSGRRSTAAPVRGHCRVQARGRF